MSSKSFSILERNIDRSILHRATHQFKCFMRHKMMVQIHGISGHPHETSSSFFRYGNHKRLLIYIYIYECRTLFPHAFAYVCHSYLQNIVKLYLSQLKTSTGYVAKVSSHACQQLLTRANSYYLYLKYTMPCHKLSSR